MVCSHGGTGDGTGVSLYLVRTGYSGNNVSSNRIALLYNSSAITESNCGIVFGTSNGYLTIKNTYTVKKTVTIFGNV